MVEVELRAGNLAAAASLLDEWGESSDYETQFRPQYPRCRALLEVQRGAGEEAQRWADETIQLAQAAGSMWDELEARRAPGDQRPDRVSRPTGPRRPVGRSGSTASGRGCSTRAPSRSRRSSSRRLSELERFEDAAAGRAPAGRAGRAAGSPLGERHRQALRRGPRAGDRRRRRRRVPRCWRRRPSISSALGLRFDSARCLLALGRAQRRLKQWRGARETLERAAIAFAALGADGWVARARVRARARRRAPARPGAS